MADLARHASFPEDEFERERRQRIEELRIERTTPGSSPANACAAFSSASIPTPSLRPPKIRSRAITRDQLAHFYRKHYVPANAVLIVVGDFSADDMLEQIEKIFGAWKAPKPEASGVACAAAPFRPPRAPGPPAGHRADPGAARQSRHHAPRSRLVSPGAREFDLTAARFIRAWSSTSANRRATPTAPRSGVNALRQHGYFTVHAAVRNDVVAATLTEMFYEMDRMRSLPVTAEELDSARSYLTRRFLARRRHPGWPPRPAFHRLSRPVAGRLSRNLSRGNSRAHRRRRSRRRAPLFRFRERANRPRRRPRPNRRAGRAVRRSHGVRREGQRSGLTRVL